MVASKTMIVTLPSLTRKKLSKIEKPIYLAFFLDLSKLLMYETYYDKLENYFGRNSIHLHYQDTDGFIFCVKTKDLLKVLEKVQELCKLFDFSILNKEHQLYSILIRIQKST